MIGEQEYSAFDDRPTDKYVMKRSGTCWGCSKEMAAELDAYYGRNEYLKNYCAKCRWTHHKSR